ncbi:uncharacterized protein sS8_3701 [Methylocaldum marinum]|jgi:hypothetical protein|uniref:Uncharacterized protein n=1 Tax=Methylocaldum marinum TaxID=1432792 RepID=A0A250KVE3_9GAMM|nr:hypothetical protein [Methylocaldum marinum]BBA35638.1 uncharacterized protein sS8_3701 [Methylocaldum marinum]
MKLLDQEEFSTKLVSESTETESPKSQVLVNGEAVDSFIDGATFEACIQYEEFYLVFTTNDCPYEESLNISLLDKQYHVLDHAVLVWPYSTGKFRLLDIVQPNLVTFEFFGETTWKVELYPHKRLITPFFSEPRGVWRKFKLRHYFKVGGKPIPQSA